MNDAIDDAMEGDDDEEERYRIFNMPYGVFKKSFKIHKYVIEVTILLN